MPLIALDRTFASKKAKPCHPFREGINRAFAKLTTLTSELLLRDNSAGQLPITSSTSKAVLRR